MSPHGLLRTGMAGLLLAAGRSRRMGALKQTLPWVEPGSTIISSAYDALAPFCRRIVAVASVDNVDALRQALAEHADRFDRFVMFIEGEADAPMFRSIWTGLAFLDQFQSGRRGIMIQPGDHPGASRPTIERLIDEFLARPDKACIPEHQGKGGHPALVPRSVAQMILATDGDYPGGLRQFWIDHPDLHRRVAVDDPSCVLDLNTPEQYESAISAHQHGHQGF